MMMRMIKKTLIINALVICTTSHNSSNLLKMLHVMHAAKFALGHSAQNKQASQSSQIINRAWQSAGVNTDEEQLMETWPHYHTEYSTICFTEEKGVN